VLLDDQSNPGCPWAENLPKTARRSLKPHPGISTDQVVVSTEAPVIVLKNIPPMPI
jgi:hypothetical protein